MRIRFLIGWAVTALAAWCAAAWRFGFGWSPEFLLVALIVFAFFLDLPEFLPVLIWGLWLFAWPIGFGPERAVVAAILLATFFGCRTLPWRPWFSVALTVVLGVIALALAIYPAFILRQSFLFAQDLFVSLLAGMILFWFLRYTLGYRTRAGGPMVQRLPIFSP